MNDTKNQLHILTVFAKNEVLSSSSIAKLARNSRSLVTIKRYLSILLEDGYLIRIGRGRSVKYKLSKKGLLLRPIDIQDYLKSPINERRSIKNFQFDVVRPPSISVFSQTELNALDEATSIYRSKAVDKDPVIQKKELMRFIIEFSWKTSQIEGNTYDLIDTEQLLLYGTKSTHNTEFESQMILNQKEALDFIIETEPLWAKPSPALIEKLHNYVSYKLNIPIGYRKSLVGITGTDYRPLENKFQIKEAVQGLSDYINNSDNVYDKALFAMIGLSYIQPFVDENKRTSRLLGNAILLANNNAPLSFRNVDDRVYKEAVLIFYEQNSILAFKKLFIDQYLFAANNYNIAR